MAPRHWLAGGIALMGGAIGCAENFDAVFAETRMSCPTGAACDVQCATNCSLECPPGVSCTLTCASPAQSCVLTCDGDGGSVSAVSCSADHGIKYACNSKCDT